MSRRCDLPVGTVVWVTPKDWRETTPFTGIVRGYDMSHSKYQIAPARRRTALGFEFHPVAIDWMFGPEVELYDDVVKRVLDLAAAAVAEAREALALMGAPAADEAIAAACGFEA